VALVYHVLLAPLRCLERSFTEKTELLELNFLRKKGQQSLYVSDKVDVLYEEIVFFPHVVFVIARVQITKQANIRVFERCILGRHQIGIVFFNL
jgi:hypothetical protein